MPIFRDQPHMYQVLGALFNKVRFHPEMGPRLRASGITIRFEYTDPDGAITIDFKGRPAEEGAYGTMYLGDCDLVPDVTFKQSGDFSHRFWFGKTNVMVAMATRQVIAQGSIPKALALLPAIRPAFDLYPQVLRELGQEDMIID